MEQIKRNSFKKQHFENVEQGVGSQQISNIYVRRKINCQNNASKGINS